MGQEDLGVYHISADPTNYEVSRTNFFTLVITDLDGITSVEYNSEFGEATDADKFANAQQVIKLSVTNFDVPHFSLQEHEIRRGNSVVRYAGTPSWNSCSLVATDYIGLKTKDILMAWQAKAYDVVKDIVRPAQDYKYDCQLVEYTPDMSQIIRSWDLKGCWISSISEDPFNVEERNKRTITATIQYDRAIPTHNILAYPYATATE